MSQLDAILRAQPVTVPQPPPRREHRRHDYTGWYLKHPREPGGAEPEDPLRSLLGTEHFADEPEPVKAPQWAKTIPEGMHRTGDLAKALGRSVRCIREWIEKGTLPDAPMRGGNKTESINALGIKQDVSYRLWPAAEINLLAQIAKEEGVIDRPHTNWRRNSNFIVRAHDEIAELRCQSSSSPG